MTENQYESPGVEERQLTDRKESAARKPGMWFAIGFAIVFVAMAASVRMHAMHPSGKAVVLCRLWQYYLFEFRGLFGPSTLGPASGGQSAAVQTLFFHVLISAIGGGVLVGARSLVFRRKRRTATNTGQP